MSRLVFCLAVLGLATGCQTSLQAHMPAEMALSPIWSDFEPPLDGAELRPNPSTMPAQPTEIPSDPRAVIGPAARPGETPAMPTPPRWDDGRDRVVDRGVYEGTRPVDPVAPNPGADQPATTPDATATGSPDDAGDAVDPFALPSGPTTHDPSFGDTDTAPPSNPGALPDDPFANEPAPTNPVPTNPVPTNPVPTNPVPETPPSDSDDLGAPPGGLPVSPLGPTTPRRAPDADLPTRPTGNTPPTTNPGSGLDDDPFGAPGPGAAPANPPAAAPPGGMDDDPFAPPGGRSPTPPAPGPVVDEDVWTGSGGTAPSTPGRDVPTLPAPAGGDDDPFSGAGSVDPAAPYTYRSTDPEERAQEQATRLLDDPGNLSIAGYPRDILMIAEAWVAMRAGPRPLAVVFYDDALRTSDQMAAEVLPVLAAHQKFIDIVAINRHPGADLDQYERAVADKFLGGSDDVPVLIVQDAKRETLLVRFGAFPGDELSKVLRTGKSAAPAERPARPIDRPTQPAVAPRAPFDAPTATRPAPRDPNAPPAGVLNDPLGPPPTMDRPRQPAVDRPVQPDSNPFDAPNNPFTAPTNPANPLPGNPNGERTNPVFSTPKVEDARRHAARLRERPSSGNLAGYPKRLLRRASPDAALAPGHKAVVIVFYDDSSRASNLQAADVLPVLVEAQSTVDVIAINVAQRAERTDAERRVVRPYYPGSLPATVVLSPTRAPVKLWYQRISARALRAGIEQAAKTR